MLSGLPPEDLIPGGHPRFGIRITNSGRSPALNLREITTYKVLFNGEAFVPEYTNNFKETPSVTVIQPGTVFELYTTPTDGSLLPPMIEGLKSGRVTFRYYGKITYDDIFGVSHHTNFCMFVGTDLKNVGTCRDI